MADYSADKASSDPEDEGSEASAGSAFLNWRSVFRFLIIALPILCTIMNFTRLIAHLPNVRWFLPAGSNHPWDDPGSDPDTSIAPAPGQPDPAKVSWILIVLGATLVVLGILTIVVLLRRNDDDVRLYQPFSEATKQDMIRHQLVALGKLQSITSKRSFYPLALEVEAVDEYARRIASEPCFAVSDDAVLRLERATKELRGRVYRSEIALIVGLPLTHDAALKISFDKMRLALSKQFAEVGTRLSAANAPMERA